jgi:integrase
MTRPYSIYVRNNGIYYAQFPFEVDGKSFQRSTGTRDRREAERTILKWYREGNVVPSGAGTKTTARKSKASLEKIQLFQMLKSGEFTFDDVKAAIRIFTERKIIKSVVYTNTPEACPIEEFLQTFWDYDKSPYVKEKLLRGQSIHRDYCITMNARINIYWIKRLKGREIGSITVADVKAFFNTPEAKNLAPKTINSVISSLTIPMKWAFYNEMTENNCFDGIMKCENRSAKRKILTMEQAAAVFKEDWENDSAKLANAVAMYTGMRQGEIAGLRIEDVGTDRLYVRHSWSKYDGLKCCKNGEEREVAIPPMLRDMLLAQAKLNPYHEGLSGFVFFGQKPKQPTDPKNWLKYLHRALKATGYSDPESICFHSWRHLWCSRVCDLIRDKRIVMTGSGHKTEFMLDHYSEHIEKENALDKLETATDKLFLPIIKQGEKNDVDSLTAANF